MRAMAVEAAFVPAHRLMLKKRVLDYLTDILMAIQAQVVAGSDEGKRIV